MAKVSIDIAYVKESLSKIGYVISDCIERENNGTNWQIKFSNSGACVTVYDTNIKKNTVVNGRCENGEAEELKTIVDRLKCKELVVDPLNEIIVQLINRKKEDTYYDYKQKWHIEGKDGDLLHDIICLANNVDNREAYLIVGVKDDYEVCGVEIWRKSNEVLDFLKSKRFAGGYIPEIELLGLYYKHKKIDVLVIKSSSHIPFYLSERYKDVGTQIYTRVGDTNTPKDRVASYSDAEKLWKKHFEKNNLSGLKD